MARPRATEDRIGASIRAKYYQKLCKIAQMLGRSKSDLLKEGIWEIINRQKTKN